MYRFRRVSVACCLLTMVGVSFAPAWAGPRDAIAVLNRCGKPLRGDDIVLDDSVAGGHLTLKYERAYLHFDKVALDGWTFTYGTHRKLDHLDAVATEKYMPCLADALTDSAQPDPIKPVTAVARVETSVKRDYQRLLVWSVVAIVVIGLILYLLSLRKREDEEE